MTLWVRTRLKLKPCPNPRTIDHLCVRWLQLATCEISYLYNSLPINSHKLHDYQKIIPVNNVTNSSHYARVTTNTTSAHIGTSAVDMPVYRRRGRRCTPAYSALHCIYGPPYFCLYLRQILTDFNNSFTGTLCGQFVIKLLL